MVHFHRHICLCTHRPGSMIDWFQKHSWPNLEGWCWVFQQYMWQAPSQLLLSFSLAWRKILSVGHLLHCDSINEGTGKNCLIYYSEWQFAVWGRLTQEHIHLKPWCQAEGDGSIGYQCNQCDALCFQQFYKKKKQKQYKFYFNFQSFKTCSRLTKISTSIEIIPWACSHLDHKSPHPGSEWASGHVADSSTQAR